LKKKKKQGRVPREKNELAFYFSTRFSLMPNFWKRPKVNRKTSVINVA
jgi:hypothetical protein